MKPKILFVLPGLHDVARGAEVAFEQIGAGLCEEGFEVTLMGTGPEIPGRPYHYIQGKKKNRTAFESYPKFPPLRSEYRWEELSFVPSILRKGLKKEFDITVTCSYPFVNWALRFGRRKKKPLHVYITENGDWAAHTSNREYRYFGCEGLVCTNPEYYERNHAQWPSVLIPNGVLTDQFTPGNSEKSRFGIPEDAPVVCMVSALIESKYPDLGIRAVAALDNVHLLLAGDGPMREPWDTLGKELLGDRYHRITVPMDQMPAVYRSGDLFMHLSREEAFGNIYIEAAACGKTVIAHDTPTTRWILGEHGVFLDTSHHDALVNTLKQQLQHPKSPGQQTRARAELVDRFDWPVVCKQYAAFFRDLLTQ
ncbi:glycosyltransferase family 4 protein [Kiritimatiellaeota bacterium B1221]|nr:glycosyltransferase family 4 protein [Kiritimatiellaeota bacterium B1221]